MTLTARYVSLEEMAGALEFIRSAQNTDGGWGYKPGGMSYVEPTSAVLLALESQGQAAIPAYAHGRDFLLQLQHPDGGWGIAALDPDSGWMTAWAIWALAHADKAAAARGAEWLVRVDSLHATDPADVAGIRQTLKIDGSLMGFPWQPGDAGWVFPTALALGALHALGHDQHPRVQDGIKFLLDRAIPSGGWNIGNPFVGTAQLPPTIINTALVLIGLGGFRISTDIISKGQVWLAQRLTQVRTAAELSWGAWALPDPALLARLQALQRPDGSWDSNPLTTAIAVLAGADKHE